MKKKFFIAALTFFVVRMASGATLTLITPNGGELCLGRSFDITWTAAGLPAGSRVKLVLFKEGVKMGIIADNLNSGSSPYAWTVGRHARGTAVAGSGYRVRLRTMDDSVEDFDNAPFAIAACPTLAVAPVSRSLSTRPFSASATTVRLTYPNGGQRLVLGQNVAITWEHENARPEQHLKATLVSSSGSCRNEIAQRTYDLGNIPVSAGSLIWEINPTHLYDEFNYIRLSPVVAGDFSPDESDFCFKIQTDTVFRLLSPNGGEGFAHGSTIDVRWEIINPKPWQRLEVMVQAFNPTCIGYRDDWLVHRSFLPVDAREVRLGGPGSWAETPGAYKICVRVLVDVSTTFAFITGDESEGCFMIR